MKKRLANILGIVGLVFGAAAVANADSFTLTQGELLGLQEAPLTSVGSLNTPVDQFGEYVALTGEIVDGKKILRHMQVSAGDVNMQLTGSDTFSMDFQNVNDDYWGVMLYVTIGSQTTYFGSDPEAQNSYTWLANDAQWKTLTWNLNGLEGEVSDIGFVFATKRDKIAYYAQCRSGLVPVYQGDILHLNARSTPTPLPATALLFGSGLAGLGIFRRKKTA